MRISAGEVSEFFHKLPYGNSQNYIGWEPGLPSLYNMSEEGSGSSARLFLFSAEFFWGKLYSWIKILYVLKFPKAFEQQGLKNVILFSSLKLRFAHIVGEDISQTFETGVSSYMLPISIENLGTKYHI